MPFIAAARSSGFRLPAAKRFPPAEAASAQRLAEAGAISKALLKVRSLMAENLVFEHAPDTDGATNNHSDD
jgi:hypothetical protein